MEAIFTLNNGKRIFGIWNEDLDKGYVYCYELKPDGSTDHREIEFLIRIDEELKQKYFVVNNEKVFLYNFDYDPVDVMIEKIKNSKNHYDPKDCEILATFLKDTENVGIMLELEYKILSIKKGVIRFFPSSKDRTNPILCVPTEKYHKMDNWGHKITLEADNEELREELVAKDHYFSDLCKMLREGHITLVNRSKYKKENEVKRLQK